MDGGRAYERPASPAQVLAQRDRLRWKAGGHQLRPVEQPPTAFRLVAPDIDGEAACFPAQIRVEACIVHRRLDLRSVAYEAHLAHQPGHLAGAESCNRHRLDTPNSGP